MLIFLKFVKWSFKKKKQKKILLTKLTMSYFV